MQRVAEVSVEQGAARRPRRSAHRGRRRHRPGADQLAEQHHPPEARRHPHRRRFGHGAQPDDQEGLRRRHRRHQLRPGGDRALRLCARIELGPHPGGDGRMDGRAARRQGQRASSIAASPARRSRPSSQEGYEKVLKKYPGHQGRRLLQRRIRARAGAVRRRGAARRQPAGRRHPDPGLRLRRHPGAARMPAVRSSRSSASPTTSRRSTCAETEGAKCILGSNPAYLSSEAIKLAVEILDTASRPERALDPGRGRLPHHRRRSRASSIPGAKMQKIEIGKNAFPDQAPGPDAADHARLGRDHRRGSGRHATKVLPRRAPPAARRPGGVLVLQGMAPWTSSTSPACRSAMAASSR